MTKKIEIPGSGKITVASKPRQAAPVTTDPRRRVTGTSYNAGGSIPVGGSALKESGSSRGGLIRDIVPELGNRSQATRIYEQMMNGDAAVDVSLRASKTPILGAMYFVEPFDDSPEALDIAEFVEYNLVQGAGAPLLNVLEDILRMYEYGFSVLEKVYETREWAPKRSGANRRNYTMLKKLAPRPTPTIKTINYDDNGGPISITQNAIDAKNKVTEVEIDIQELIIFTNNRKGGNLEGKSLLRTARTHWYFKSNLYNIDGIQKERHGMGFPTIHLPPGYTDADKTAAYELVTNIRTNERAGAVLPPNWQLEFIDIPGNPVDVLRSIEHHNGMIMLNTMVQFLLLGLEGTGGGRATSGSHQDMFNKSLRHVGNLICDSVNLYCVPFLVGYNYDTDKFPKLQVRNIGETKDLQQWASGISNLVAQDIITPDIELEQWARSIVDAPSKRGGVQTPLEKKTSQKGDVTSQNDGNSGADPANAEG